MVTASARQGVGAERSEATQVWVSIESERRNGTRLGVRGVAARVFWFVDFFKAGQDEATR